MRVRQCCGWVIFCLAVCAPWVSAQAQTGVSDDRVSLPEGPGSLEGVGENVGVNPNMGLMSSSVPIGVPAGFAAVTPNVDLSYSSGGGSGLLGMGWSMSMPSIERMTYRGLPEYDSQDDFAADGASQLVRIPGTSPAVYRARFEGGFVRYTWMEEGDGTQGYWIAEYPNGAVGYFGATADGALVPEARVGKDEGTFRYHLVEMVDVFGHRMVYSYQKAGEYALLAHIGYVFQEGQPSYELIFGYEARQDEGGQEKLSDAMPGFDLLLDQRLARIQIKNKGVTTSSYDLSYVPFAQSGGISLLEKVEHKGMLGRVYEGVSQYSYSQSLGGGGASPFVMDMGTLAANFGAGQSQLVDLNGDALPDIVDASQEGAHRIFFNLAQPDGSSRFETQGRLSQVGTRSSHDFLQATVQVLDINGDGFTDVVNAATGEVLLNQGTGDWLRGDTEGLSTLARELSEDVEEGELRSLRFTDFNNDKMIDVIKANAVTTTFLENRGQEGFVPLEGTMSLGAGFEEDNLELADMNGDGLLDVVRLQEGSLSYRLNHGRGLWGAWVNLTDLGLTQAQVDLAQLEDINGDALADIVVVQGATVSFALNNNADSFGALIQLESQDVEGNLPARESTTTVLIADMNGNGSSDIVWIQADGHIQALELFPLRPNLMTKITNNLGAVTEVTYQTAAQQMAIQGGWEAWRYKLPYPMNVVSQVDYYDLLTDLHDVRQYSYADGFYDGAEKQFRGFARVETTLPGDDSIEAGRMEQVYDVGAQDTYHHGLLRSSATWSAGRALSMDEMSYGDCEVAEVGQGTELPVRFICPTGSRKTLKEGQEASQWVTLEQNHGYDGYGNMILMVNHGVTAVGGQGCAACASGRGQDDFGEPCGEQCLGDEAYAEVDYVPPTQTEGRWILHAPFRSRGYGRPGSDQVAEDLIYYDGEAFEGLPLGHLTQGKATRRTVKRLAGSDEVIQAERHQFDEHGNVLVSLDPLGEPGGTTHQRRYTYEETGLRVIQVDVLLEDAQGQPYALRRELGYEPFFDLPNHASVWLRAVDGEVVSLRGATALVYDQYGRAVERYLPGNNSEQPDVTYEYDLGPTSSRVVARRRSELGGPLDMLSIDCQDGRGRSFQQRTLIEEGRYQVSGMVYYNLRSSAVRAFQPYLSDSDQCDTQAPEGVLSNRYRYDAAHRLLGSTLSDASIYGQASEHSLTYLPLSISSADAEDNLEGGAHHQTPQRSYFNGLERLVATERVLADGQVGVYQLHYDSLGHIAGTSDPAGHRKVQRFDLLGRLLEREDPNSSDVTLYVYDDASNLSQMTDPRGVVTRYLYDGNNRMVAEYQPESPEDTRIEFLYDHDPGCAEEWCGNGEGLQVAASWPEGEGARGSVQLGFDLRRRPRHARRVIQGHAFEVSNSLDNASRVLSNTYPDGRTLTYQYDLASRLVAVDGVLPELAYDERDLLQSVRYADGSQQRLQYDALLRFAEVSTQGQSGDLLQGFRYAYDRAGNLLEVEDLRSPQTRGYLSASASFRYDAWYRLVEQHIAPGQEQEEILSYDFDLMDNMTRVQSSLGTSSATPVGELSYDSFAPNAVTDFAGLAMDYDRAGNVSARGDQSLTWDFKNRLVGVERGGQEVARFVYGEDQRRLAKREGEQVALYPSEDFEVRDGITITYVRHNGDRMARLESDAMATTLMGDAVEDGQINSADAWALAQRGEAHQGHLWTSVRRLLLETGPQEGVTFLHHDHLGSLILATGLVGGQQEVLGRRAFTPTGLERPGGFGYVDEYGFTGQELDRSTGLLHFEWRYLDPQTGRWLSIDPLFATASAGKFTSLGQSTTAYNYVGGNYINRIDPTGLTLRSRIRAFFGGGGGGGKKPNKNQYQALGSKNNNAKAKKGKLKRSKSLASGKGSLGGHTGSVEIVQLKGNVDVDNSGVELQLEASGADINVQSDPNKVVSVQNNTKVGTAGVHGTAKISKHRKSVQGSIGGAIISNTTNFSLHYRSHTFTLGVTTELGGFGANGGFDFQNDPTSDEKDVQVHLGADVGGGATLSGGYHHARTKDVVNDNEIDEPSVSSTSSDQGDLP